MEDYMNEITDGLTEEQSEMVLNLLIKDMEAH